MLSHGMIHRMGKLAPALLICLAGLAVFSCSRTIERPTDTDLPIDAPATPSSLRVTLGDQTVQLSWSAADGAARYRIYRADTSAVAFRAFDSTAQTTYTDRAVTNNVTYFYRLASMTADNLEGELSPAVSARPGVYAITINEDKVYTKSLTVTLSLSAPGSGGSVRLANTSDMANRPWQGFASPKSWELEPGDGIKTVYAQFRDLSGATSLEAVTDEVILDTRAAIDSTTENSAGRPLAAGDLVLFTVATGESEGSAFVDVSDFTLECVDDGTRGDGIAGDGRYHRSWLVPAGADFEEAVVSGRFTDRVGNAAEPRVAATLVTVQRVPDGVAAFAFTEGETHVNVSWSQTGAEDFAFYRVFRASTPQVRPESTLVYSTSARTASTYADTGLEYSTTYYYAVWVYDRTGLSAGSGIVSAQTRANTAPEAVVVSNPLKLDSTRLRLTWSQSLAADFASYRVYRGTSPDLSDSVLAAIISNRSETQYTDDNLDLETTDYYYRVVVYDRGGLFAGSDVVSARRPANTAPEPVVVSSPTKVDSTRLRLTWSQSFAADFASYRVYRRTSVELDDSVLVAIISNRSETQYTDDNLDLEHTDYSYWVVVYDRGGLSAASNVVFWRKP